MSYNILSVVPGHNGSICFLQDGEVKLYIEEERLSKQKYDANPLLAMIEVLSNYEVHELVLGGTHANQYPPLTWTGLDAFSSLAMKYHPNIKITNCSTLHHLGHAAGAFYNSNFDVAVAIVVDGAGSVVSQEFQENDNKLVLEAFETETVMLCEYPNNFELLYRHIGNNWINYPFDIDLDRVSVTNSCGIVKTYEAVTAYLGFPYIEAGKTMGLAPYGKPDNQLPTFFTNAKSNRNTFVPQYPAGALVDHKKNPYVKLDRDPRIWHNEKPELITDVEKNMAFAIQEQTQKLVGDLIEKYTLSTGIKNVVISGGYALNCTANYYYKKRFPNINLYVDPVSHDGGTAIGLAKSAWFIYASSNDIILEKNPLTTLYLGKDRNYELGHKPTDFLESEVTPADVAAIIANKEIVAVFNGSAEAGPRALGNRSFLYDPRDPNGKDRVNIVKGREWFRPFAGTVLVEHANDWFDMAGLNESPFMMYAVDVLKDKIEQIPCITHVDNTCRVQTVTKDQNSHFYELIEEFYKITGVPILLNTSFNLAGWPLVENFEDALDTLRASNVKYLYLPYKNTLLSKL